MPMKFEEKGEKHFYRLIDTCFTQCFQTFCRSYFPTKPYSTSFYEKSSPNYTQLNYNDHPNNAMAG